MDSQAFHHHCMHASTYTVYSCVWQNAVMQLCKPWSCNKKSACVYAVCTHLSLSVRLHTHWYSCLSGTATVNSLQRFYCVSFNNLRHFSFSMCARCSSVCVRVCTTELAVCVSVSVRYAPSQRWHIDTILHVLTTVNAASFTGSSFITLCECIMIVLKYVFNTLDF